MPLSLSQIQLLENTLLDWHNRTLRNDYRHVQALQGRVVEASFPAQHAQGKGQGTLHTWGDNLAHLGGQTPSGNR